MRKAGNHKVKSIGIIATNPKTTGVKVPQEVKQYEQARKKFVTAMEKAHKLSDSPAVKAFMQMQDQSEQPSAEEIKKRELFQLYNAYLTDANFMSDQLWLLAELTFHAERGEANLPNLNTTITELDKRMDATMDAVKKAFGFLGIAEKESDTDKEKAA